MKPENIIGIGVAGLLAYLLFNQKSTAAAAVSSVTGSVTGDVPAQPGSSSSSGGGSGQEGSGGGGSGGSSTPPTPTPPAVKVPPPVTPISTPPVAVGDPATPPDPRSYFTPTQFSYLRETHQIGGVTVAVPVQFPALGEVNPATPPGVWWWTVPQQGSLNYGYTYSDLLPQGVY